MKSAITILALAFSLSVNAQTKDSGKVNIDTVLLFSINDLQPLYDRLTKSLSYEQAAPFVQYIEKLVADKTKKHFAKAGRK